MARWATVKGLAYMHLVYLANLKAKQLVNVNQKWPARGEWPRQVAGVAWVLGGGTYSPASVTGPNVRGRGRDEWLGKK